MDDLLSMFLKRLNSRFSRELSLRFARRLCSISVRHPVISFTFDDFPRSALHRAGAILREHDLHGTYYTSLGLIGQVAPTGQIFSSLDLPEVIRHGHELACHTFDHCHSWNTSPMEFEESILRNQKAIETLVPGTRFENLSYPISHPRPQTKRRTARYYTSARGGGQTFNVGTADLNYLKAFFIEQSRDNFDAIKQMIDDTVRVNGWLIFVTHDVCDASTRFGCTPQLFKRIVEYSIKSGATVLPVNQALKRIGEIRR